jgi:3-deoxy-manno-octulosonate cytidylyltransferase (CMP-KDO synthetase)
MKTVGIIPARMAASRFPGKPLAKIHGRTMVEHVYERAKLYKKWDGLFLATCDEEIAAVGKANNWPVIMTKDTHTRALDRVAEAAEKCGLDLLANDVVVCVQGDEPMLHPEMIAASIQPLENSNVPCTVLAMQIAEKETFLNPDTVKIVHNQSGEVLYTSRSPVPYCKGTFSVDHGAKRIYGIFAWRFEALKQFTSHAETFLEKVESCDSNRILDMKFRQVIAPFPFSKSFSVDSPEDLKLVETHMKADRYWGSYK